MLSKEIKKSTGIVILILDLKKTSIEKLIIVSIGY
jgi:hypothetical protein